MGLNPGERCRDVNGTARPRRRAGSPGKAGAPEQAQVLHYVTVQQQAAMLSSIDVFWLLALIFGTGRSYSLMRKPGLGAAPPPAH
jgi:hypothetical protein